MSKMGLSPPPPPGPPPSEPPPLPPVSSHPFASQASSGRNAAFNRAAGRLSAVNAFRKAGAERDAPRSVEPIVGFTAGHAQTASIASHRSRKSNTPPTSPGVPKAPPVSPRSSSLLAPAQIASSSTSRESHSPRSTTAKPPRTPSRHLLQSALDLAQRAVEMDKVNDVAGALSAYTEAVVRLKSVMERVGIDGSRGEDGKRRRSTVGKSEEEGRTLRGIHDAYVARIQLLSTYHPEQTDDTSITLRTSSATILPSPSNMEEEETPTRESLDEAGTSVIGNLMLSSDQETRTSQDFHRAARRLSPALYSPKNAHDRLIPLPSIQPLLPSSESMAYGNGESGALQRIPEHSQPAPSIDRPLSLSDSHSSTRPAGSRDSVHSESSRRRTSRVSVGLDTEADLTGIDGVEIMEVLAKTPIGLPSPLTRAPATPSAKSSRSSLRDERPLPPLPGQPTVAPRKASLSNTKVEERPSSGSLLVSPSTLNGTISQRRQSRTLGSISSLADVTRHSARSSVPFPQVDQPLRSAGVAQGFVLKEQGRSRAKSQPGQRPSFSPVVDAPPLPVLRNKSSFPSRPADSLRIMTSGLAPPLQITSKQGISPRSLLPLPDSAVAPSTASGSLISPLPEPQPLAIAHRPFHLLRVLLTSMDPDGPGCYLTGAIHIPPAVWKAADWTGATTRMPVLPRIAAQETKVRCIEALIQHLVEIQRVGQQLLDGPREAKYGSEAQSLPRLPAAKIARTAEEFCHALDGLDEEMEQSHKLLVNKGVAVRSWKGKKSGNVSVFGMGKAENQNGVSSWGSRLSRSMDKMTNGKGLDSPDKYVDLLSSLCGNAQVINNHLACFTGPCSPAYHTLPQASFEQIESRIRRAAEFIGAVVVTFILDDFKQFFLRYLKGGVRYLED